MSKWLNGHLRRWAQRAEQRRSDYNVIWNNKQIVEQTVIITIVQPKLIGGGGNEHVSFGRRLNCRYPVVCGAPGGDGLHGDRVDNCFGLSLEVIRGGRSLDFRWRVILRKGEGINLESIWCFMTCWSLLLQFALKAWKQKRICFLLQGKRSIAVSLDLNVNILFHQLDKVIWFTLPGPHNYYLNYSSYSPIKLYCLSGLEHDFNILSDLLLIIKSFLKTLHSTLQQNLPEPESTIINRNHY